MATSKKGAKASRSDAQQVFRQFAWNLAGTLVKTGPAASKLRRRNSTAKTAAK